MREAPGTTQDKRDRNGGMGASTGPEPKPKRETAKTGDGRQGEERDEKEVVAARSRAMDGLEARLKSRTRLMWMRTSEAGVGADRGRRGGISGAKVKTGPPEAEPEPSTGSPRRLVTAPCPSSFTVQHGSHIRGKVARAKALVKLGNSEAGVERVPGWSEGEKRWTRPNLSTAPLLCSIDGLRGVGKFDTELRGAEGERTGEKVEDKDLSIITKAEAGAERRNVRGCPKQSQSRGHWEQPWRRTADGDEEGHGI